MMKQVEICQQKSKSKTYLNNKLKETMEGSFPLFNTKEIARLRKLVVSMYSRGSKLEDIINETVKLTGKIERHSDSRFKQQNVKGMLDLDLILRGYPVVFWLCSKHSNPADKHAKLQGKIYCDRFWNNKLVQHGAPLWLIDKVRKTIVDNRIISIQNIQGPPYYLGTRPYCKHVFQPLDLLTVLTVDVKTIEKRAIKTYGKPVKRGAAYDYVKHGMGII